MNKKLSLLVLGGTLLFGSGLAKKQIVATQAYTSGGMPTEINDRDLTDAEVNAYYQDVDDTKDVNGKSGDELLAVLHNIIKDHEEYNYDTLGPVYKITDRDWELSNNVDLSAFDYGEEENPYLVKLYADYNNDANTADLYKNEDAPKVSFDKEHIWAQSMGGFGRSRGAGSDLHALWPSDRKGNQSAHSNYNFAEPTIDRKAYKNDKSTISGWSGKITGFEHKVFEPLDEFKGDVARAMFYMPARYYLWEDAERPKLSLVNGSPDPVVASPTQAGLAGDLATLLEWHEQDPVSEFEIHRNNLLYNNYQKNRNPFIDHPEWARIAYDTTYSGPGAQTTAETSSVGTNSDPFRALDLVDLTVDTSAVKKTYFKKELMSLAGLSVRAHYSDGSSKIIRTYDSTIQAGNLLADEGEHTVTISYTHQSFRIDPDVAINQTKTADFVINVKEIELRDALMISEVYGGGGNSNAPFINDYVEIYNASDEPITLAGKSVQYSPAKSNSYKQMRLDGIIEPDSFYLIHLFTKNNPDSGVPMPLHDFWVNVGGAHGMSATDMKIALLNKTAQFDDEKFEYLDEDADLIDFLGGGSADKALGTKKTGANNTLSYQREFKNDGPVNNRNNSTDFITAAPDPMNSALSVAEKILVGDTPDQCETRYAEAKELVLKLSEDKYEEVATGLELIEEGQITYFQTGNYGIMPSGRARYEAWATHHGDTHPYEDVSEEVGETPVNMLVAPEMGYTLIVFLLVLTLAGYGLLQKQQTN